LEPLADEFQVNMNYANPQEHFPEVERNNCVIKERVWLRTKLSPSITFQAFAAANE
jgi:hypothetical protein